MPQHMMRNYTDVESKRNIKTGGSVDYQHQEVESPSSNGNLHKEKKRKPQNEPDNYGGRKFKKKL